MPKAIWNGEVIAAAESDAIQNVDSNIYFPRSCVFTTCLRPSPTHTTCPWKGIASYYDVVVNGEVNQDAAWYYPQPLEQAESIKDHIAFWRGVSIED